MHTALIERFQSQREHAPVLAQKPLKYRLQQLEKLRVALKGEPGQQLIDALHQDFGKSRTEAQLTELLPTLDTIKLIKQNLKRWAAPKRVRTPLPLMGSTSYTQAEPKGTALVISPWNYPIFLSLHPLCHAIAAGNTVILKPSELTPHTSEAMRVLLTSLFEPNEVFVATGGVEVGQTLLDQPFNHIFFTGSTRVGKLVMAAAAKHLSSVTLELGGKSPTLVDQDGDGYRAGARVAWAKWTNSGQICIAPDHVYVHTSKVDDFTRGLLDTLEKLYGKEPTKHADYVQMVNEGHFNRLKGLIEEAKEEPGKVVAPGTADHDTRKIGPFITIDPPKNGALMREELFGPALPVFTFDDLDEPLREIASRPHPLVVYIYSKNRRRIRKIQRETRAGATAVNISLLQIANGHLPFGGVGESGMGKTNGHAGFLEFSNARSSFYQWGIPATKFLSAPYTRAKSAAVWQLIRRLY